MKNDNLVKDIRDLSLQALQQYVQDNGHKKFRADQIYNWVWYNGVAHFEQMTNLPADLKNLLSNFFVLNKAVLTKQFTSSDGTVKNLIQLFDRTLVESVLIPFFDTNRYTACISSQVGCSLDCTFCATAKLQRKRNLTFGEIFDQVQLLEEQSLKIYRKSLTNIVLMGMGEPLLNYANVKQAIERIISHKGLAMSPKRITLSTVGIPKMIKKMADDALACKLAVSLHSASDQVRKKLIPYHDKTSLKELLDSLNYWYQKTKSKITFEYIVFNGINDTQEDLDKLIAFCKKVPSKVNIIEYNSIEDPNGYQMASSKIIQNHLHELKKSGIVATLRKSRGQDIHAACGQLANKY